MDIEFNLDVILKEKRLNITKAALLCDLSYPTVYSIVRNQQVMVNLKTLAQLSSALGVEVKDLFRVKGTSV